MADFFDEWREGVYSCESCNTEVYSSAEKFKSTNKFPAFRKPIADNLIETKPDYSLGFERTAIACSKCNSQLGFRYVDKESDGTTSIRHSLLSKKLSFTPKEGAGLPQNTENSPIAVTEVKVVERVAAATTGNTVAAAAAASTQDSSDDETSDSEEEDSSDEEPIPTKGTTRATAVQKPVPKAKPSSTNWPLLVGIVGVVSAVAVGVGFYIYRNNQKKTQSI